MCHGLVAPRTGSRYNLRMSLAMPIIWRGTVEIAVSLAPRPQISHVVFDFDGTLSWLRHGWPAMMMELFRARLPRLAGESAEQVDDLLHGITLGMNGQPTIRQMIRYADIVRERGEPELDPELLRREYQDRLDGEIASRSASIREGRSQPDEFVVHGARAFLDKLRCEGLTLIVLSGTIEHRVKEEAELLGLTGYFGRHIYGSTPDPMQFSKRAVFERLLEEEGITAGHLLSFGDGGVEIQHTRELGGIAVAVCSDEEHNGSGVMDPFKHRQLLAAGAHVAVPDFRDAVRLFDHLRGR